MLCFAAGSPTTKLSDSETREALFGGYDLLGTRKRVIAIPPDFTRMASRAGQLTCLTHEYYADPLVDVMPAVGTHFEMPSWQLEKMFPTVPPRLFRYHDWRNDVETIGEVPAEFVSESTEGIYCESWPCQMNRIIWDGGHDLVVQLVKSYPTKLPAWPTTKCGRSGCGVVRHSISRN